MKTSLANLKHIFRSHSFLILGLSSILFFGLVFGQLISVVGGKKILEPFSIHIYDKDGIEIQEGVRIMQLSRSGLYTRINPNASQVDPWEIKEVFLQKILVSLPEEIVNKEGRVSIDIGDESFEASFSEVFQEWYRVDKIEMDSLLSEAERESLVSFVAPSSVSLQKSNLPFLPGFLRNTINYSGDHVFVVSPFSNAVKHFLGIVLLVIISLATLRFFNIGELANTFKSSVVPQLFITVSVALSGLIFLVTLIAIVYSGNEFVTLAEANAKYLPHFARVFVPKPVEQMQFFLSLLLLPALTWLGYVLSGLVYPRIEKYIQSYQLLLFALTGILTFLYLYAGLALNGFSFVRDTVFFKNPSYFLLASIMIFVFLSLFFKTKGESKVIKTVLWLGSIVGLLFVFLLNLFVQFSGILPVDIDPVLYPVMQVISGEHMFAPVTSLYGAYASFLAPVFSVIEFNTFSFSVVMASLIVVSLTALLFFLWQVCHNKIIALSGFVFILFYTLLATRIVPEYYYQYWPIRILFPMVSLLIVVLYLRYKSRFLYLASFPLFGFAMLWNFDTGIVVMFSWLILLIYDAYAIWGFTRQFFWQSFLHILLAVVGVILAIGTFVGLTVLTGGEVPDYSLMFIYQKMFFLGYHGILLVPPPHLWSFLILIYMVGMAYVVGAFVKRKIGFFEKIVAYLVALGLGLFVYYEGQASDVTLFRIWYPALLLVILFVDVGFVSYLRKNRASYSLVAGTLLLVVLFSGAVSLFVKVPEMISMVQNSWVQGFAKETVGNIEFIRSHTEIGERVMIIDPFMQAILYTETATQPALSLPSITDIIFPEDMDTFVTFLSDNTHHPIFVKSPLSQYDKYDTRIAKVLESYDATTFSGDGMVLLRP